MKLAWTGLALLAGAWLFTSGYYHHPDGWTWLTWGILVSAGSALMGGCLPRLPGRYESIAAGLLVLPAAWLLPWPARTGVLLLAAGFLSGAFPDPGRCRRWGASSALAGGAVLLAQHLAMYFYEAFTARSHELPGPLAGLLGLAAGWLGIDSALSDNAVSLFSMRQTNVLAPSWELLLDPASVCFLAGGTALLLLGRRASWRTWLGLGGAVALWLPVRSGLLMAGYLHRILRTDYDAPLDAINMFWSPWLHLILLAGPMLLAWKLARPCGPECAAASPPPLPGPGSWRRWALPLAAALAASGLTAAVMIDLPGRPNPGTILFHELQATQANPAWERVDKPYDLTWYGHLSGYNYRCIYDYLGKFYDVQRRTDPLTDESLKHVAVLVIKTPTVRYSPEEVACVERFVNAGGGLLLIGEHTDVFGTGTTLNDFARPLGFSFRYDCLFDVDHIFDEAWRPAAVKHPIVADMKNFDFAVSCSIEPGWTAGRAVIRSTGLKSLPPDYHASNFYPLVEDRPDMRYGSFIQLWSQRYGRGRVAAFTDSTVFSNFAAFEPGKPELLMGMVDWLHRTGGFRYAWGLLGLAGAGALAGGVVLGRGHVRGWALTAAAVLAGWSGAVFAARAVNESVLPQPDNVRPITKVVIDQALCDVPLSKSGFIAGDARGFGIFERWILRLGYYTWREADVPDEDTALLVLPFPTGSVSDQYLKRLEKYVRQGGHVLVVDSPENLKSSANSVLWPFRLASNNQAPAINGPLSAPGATTTRPTSRPNGSGAPSVQEVLRASPPITATSAWEVTGGEPLATIGGKSVIATTRYGAGTVTLVGCGSLFTDVNMGATGDVEPTEPLLRVYNLEFSLIRSLVQGAADK